MLSVNSEGRLEPRVLREKARNIATELAHTFLYQIMVNMTFVPKIIFDICKRFFQLGHFTCDQGQDDFSIEAVASSQSTTDSTTLEYILLQILLLRTRINTKKKKKRWHEAHEAHETRLQEKGQL